jgi:glycosyltransferase involved in cell wall biosynthesis
VLNALFLDPGASGGPETYLRGLAPALARVRPEGRLTVVTTRSGAAALARDGWPRWCGVWSLPCEEGQRGRRQLAEQLLLPAFARRLGADVLHSLASTGPIRTPGLPHVVTLHDVTFMQLRTFGPATTWGMAQVVTRAARDADALISGTAAARDAICATLDLPRDAFAVVHHGVDRPAARGSTPPAEVRARYGLGDRRVVLCVAAKRPHKNQELLVRAARTLPDDVVVVLAGHPEPYDAELRALAGELGVRERVVFADWVPDEDLEGLWALAGCAAFPTRAEGFGIPLIEALSRGVAVAASDIPVFAEVADDLPRWFRPDDPASAAAAIVAALEDPCAVATAGPAWAARFTWEAAAHGTWSAYERALA